MEKIEISKQDWFKIANAENSWNVYCELFQFTDVQRNFAGALDHIEVDQEKKLIIFHDRGNSIGGRIHDYTFALTY